jgi:hypothetical protein
MSTRDEYRSKALDCRIQAEALRDPRERSSLVRIAQLYTKLANRIVGRYDRGTARQDQNDSQPENDS